MPFLAILGRGFVIWLIPLLISFAFYTPDQTLTISYALFKSVMVLTLTLVTLGVNLYKPPMTFSPLVVALVYTVVSLALDLFIVVPMASLTFAAYVEQIALIYIIIPALTWGILSRNREMALA